MINNNITTSGSSCSKFTSSSSSSSSSSSVSKLESVQAILPSPTTCTPTPGANVSSQQTPTVGEGWVAKRGPGKLQLINSSVFEEQAHAKVKERLRRKEEKEKLKLKNWIQKSRGPPYNGSVVATTHTPHEVMIAGERYRVAAYGSKLVKISGESIEQTLGIESESSVRFNLSTADDPKAANTTPKKAVVGGVNFVRSKNGNLWRSGLVKASR